MAILTEEQKKLIYAQHGVDESEYELFTEGDNYSLRPRFKPTVQPPEPTPSTTELATKNLPPSGMESFGRAAATSVLPTAGGLLAAAGTMAVLPEPFVSKVGALGALGLAGVAGLAGSFGASKLQEEVVPQDFQQKFFTRPEDVQENPLATAAGGFVPSALTFRPSVKDLGTLASGVKNIPNLVRGAEGALTTAEQAALLNATANIAPAAGMEAYDVLSGNKPFDPLSAAANVLPGALFTKPTALGRRLGFADTATPEPLADAQSVPPQNDVSTTPPITPAAPEGVVISEGQVLPSSSIRRKKDDVVWYKDAQGKPQKFVVAKGDAVGTPENPDATIMDAGMTEAKRLGYRSAKESAEAIEGVKFGETPEQSITQRELDFYKARAQEERQKAVELQKQEAEQLRLENEKKAEQLKMALGKQASSEEIMKRGVSTVETRKAPLWLEAEQVKTGKFTTTEKRTPVYGQEDSPFQQANAEIEAAPKTEAEWIQEEFDRRAKYQAAEETPVDLQKEFLKEEQWKADFEKEATRRGLTTRYVDELPNKARGMYEPSKRQVTIARKAATKDTFSHEVGHGYVEDLLATGRKEDEQQILRGLEFADPEGRKFKTKADWDALDPEAKRLIDERFVQQLGEKGAKLREVELYGGKRQKFKQWVGDVGSNLKYKLGIGSGEDVARKTAVGQRFDQPEYTQPAKSEIAAAAPKMQGAEEKSDYDQYQEVQAKLKEQFAKGDFSSPEFQKLWQESENIKNRNGGHVPKPPESGAKMQEASEDPNAKPFFAPSRYDKVARLGKTGEELSGSLKKFDSEASRLEGQVGNKIISAFGDYNEREVARVAEYRHAQSNGLETNIKLTANETALKTQLDKTYKDIGKMVQDSGLLVKAGEDFRKMILKESGYQPNVISQKVINAWQERTPEAAKYDKLYVDYMVKKGMPEEEARQTLQEYKQAVGNAGVTPDIKYNAIRKAEGMGLPWELVEQNPAVAARRYGRRVANDLAFFKYIQDDPRMLKALGMKDQQGRSAEELAQEKGVKLDDVEWIGNAEEVKSAMRSVQGIDVPQNPIANAAIRAIGNSVMQTGTALRNIVGLPTAIAGYYGVGPKTILEALVKMPQRAARAFENNAVRASFGDLEAGGIIEGHPNKFIALADKYSQFMRKYTGRDFSDKFEGEFTYSLGETLAAQWFAQAKAGDIKARRMLNRFGTTVDDLKSKFMPKEKISQEDISKVAKNFVDATRGSYGPSGLPSFAIEGGAAPMVSLARWSIEKANVFQKDIIRPITEHGDWMPLLKTAFAGLLTGTAVEKLNELLAGKRGADATIEETWAEKDVENITAKVIGLLQLGGFGGMFSEAAKAGMATVQGKETKFNNPVSMPALTMAETYWQQTAYALEAAQQGEEKLEVLSELMKSLLKATYQNYRYADANFVNPEEAQRKEKFRDMRVYKELKHEPPQAAGSGNPYTGLAARKFKRAEGLEEAASALPQAIDAAVKKSGGDYSKLKEGIEGLRRNSYQTFPKDPVQAFQYYQYLSETLGPEEAMARYEDYLKQSMVNKVKSSLVPKI